MKTVLIPLVFVSLGLASCNGQTAKDEAKSNDGSEDGDGLIEMSAEEDGRTPDDSTGASGALGIAFGNAAEDGLALLDPVESLKISDTIELTLAKFNVAAIKLKGTKEESAKEVEHEAAGREKEKKDSTDHEALAADGEAALAGKDKNDEKTVVDHKAKREAVRQVVAGKCDELKQKTQADVEQEAKVDKSTRFPGPYVYDAIAGTISGDVPSPISADDGSYRRVEFQLKRHCSNDATDPLVGNVFVIHGNVTQGDAVVPFAIAWHHAVNLRLTGDKAFVVEPEQDNILNVVFDLEGWFEGVDFAAADVDPSGTIFVDKQNNREIMKAIRTNIKKHARFGKDGDGDGVLTADETSGTGDATAADVEE